MIGYIFMASVIFSYRKELLLDGIFSGLLLGIIFMLEYLILLSIYPNLFEKIWIIDNLSGLTVLRIPIEELLWAFSWGLLAGPIYEFYLGLRFAKSRA
jgi:hypothetical protein